MTEEMAVKVRENLPMVRSDSLFFNIAMFEHVQRVAQVFAKSDMVPDHFKNNIPNCVIGLNLAERMGVDPFMLFQNMYIVHGNPGIEAKLAIALTNGCGRFEPLQFEHENKGNIDALENRGSWSCIAYAKDLKSGKVLESAAVSIEMAKAEGWYGKSGSKWKTMPELMLEYRSAMFFARVYCPEVLLGLKTREEIYDIVDLEPGRNGTYASPEAAKEPKEKPNYAAQELKDNLDAGDKQIEGFSKLKDKEIKQQHGIVVTDSSGENEEQGQEPDPTLLEQGEPEGILPDGVDAVEWFTASRCTSLEKAILMLKVYKEIEPKVIEMTKSDEYAEVGLGRKLIVKEAKLITYIADIKAKAEVIADEVPPDDDEIPEFEQEPGPDKYDEVKDRLPFINAMRKYLEKDHEKYDRVLKRFKMEGMNDCPHNKANQDLILEDMSVEFGEE